MRRGQHTSRVLEAMRVPGVETVEDKIGDDGAAPSDLLMAEETGF